MRDEKIYPIKVVSNRTGLSLYVIRAWEKRYSAVKPFRTETNRRLYSTEDIQKLQLLSKAIRLDHKIGTIANLSTDELENLINEDDRENLKADPINTDLQQKKSPDIFIETFMNNVSSLDSASLNSILKEASIVLSNQELLGKVIAPIIYQIGDKWRVGEIRVSHEHIASLVIRDFLTNLRNTNQVNVNTPGILIGTPRSNVHELGALLIAAMAAIEGWKVTYLGPDLPAEEIVSVANNKNIKVVCISLVFPYSDPIIVSELKTLGSYLSQDTKLIVGGRAANSYKDTLDLIDATLITDLATFREQLMTIENSFTA